MQWPGETGIEFHLPYSDWIDLLRTNEFEIERLIELKAPPDADATSTTTSPPEWAWKWPHEEIWVARLTG